MTRRLCLLLTLLAFGNFSPLHAQLRWIADARFCGGAFPSLYSMIADGRPAILAVGSLSSESADNLLASGALQDLAANHGAGPCAASYSKRDLNVAFIDVRVFPGHAAQQGIPVVSMDEEDATLSKPGWDNLYSILGTQLYLVTPDRLVRPLKGRNAAEIYAEVQAWATKVKPTAAPDLRLLDAEMQDGQAKVRVQNFSTRSIASVDLLVEKDGRMIASVHYSREIPSLEDALIDVPLPHGYNTKLTIVAKASGDCNDLNNSWSGLLRESSPTTVAVAIQ